MTLLTDTAIILVAIAVAALGAVISPRLRAILAETFLHPTKDSIITTTDGRVTVTRRDPEAAKRPKRTPTAVH
ncbi:MAG: hypothetical protein ACYDAG_03075 [Chloroflexota bacterium]